MTLPPPAKDQEPCCVYSAPVMLLPFSCSKTHGSGNCELSTVRMQCWPLAKPSHPTPLPLLQGAQRGWSGVCTVTENTAKARHSLRDKVGLCSPVHPSNRELQPLFVLCNFFHLNCEHDNCPQRDK